LWCIEKNTVEKTGEKMPVQLIEIYRFLYAVCMNLHLAKFEGLNKDDVWLEKFLPAGADVMKFWQMAEDIGGLWSLIMGNNRYQGGNIDENLFEIEGVMCRLLEEYPQITYERGRFRQMHPLYRLSIDNKATMPEYHGDHPDLDVWRSILTQEEYDYLLTCIYKNGDWRRQLKPLIGMFRIARLKLPEYL
jgi:hypothetical protein